MADPITSMATKRAALAAWLLDALGAFDSRYKVDQHVRPVVLDGSSSEVRAKVMGTPVRYARSFFRCNGGRRWDRRSALCSGAFRDHHPEYTCQCTAGPLPVEK